MARGNKGRKRYDTLRHDQNRMANLLDDVAEFEEFRASTLKAIRKDIKNGMDAKKLREKWAAIIQGKLITDALTTDDVAKAATIGKDLLDRVEGKATEKKEVTHRLSGLNEKELDAVLQSEVQDLEDMQERFNDSEH